MSTLDLLTSTAENIRHGRWRGRGHIDGSLFDCSGGFRLTVVLIIVCAFAWVPMAQAADITLSDTCSLANAIRSANGDTQVSPANECATGDTTEADTIIFVEDVEITAALPAITSDVTIAAGYTLSTPSPADGTQTTYNFSLLTINSGTVYIQNLGLAGVTDSAVKIVKNTSADLNVYFTTGSVTNRSSSNGGAFFIDGGATVGIYLSHLVGNAAAGGHGGVVYAKNSTVTLERNNFGSNSATANGGAVYFLNDSGNDFKLTVEGNSFRSNQANDNDSNTNMVENGGAIFIDNGTDNDASTSILTGNTFSRNSARYGGAVYLADGRAFIDNSTLDLNSASGAGGSIWAAGGALTIRHSTIVRNRGATGGGVGVYSDDNANTDDPTVDVFNSIIAENTETDAENGVCLESLLNENKGNIIEDDNCIASQAEMAPLRMELVPFDGTSLPRSVINHFYRLLEGSPAIDNGVDGEGEMLAQDQTGHQRPEGAGYDSGSFEFDVQEVWPGDAPPNANAPSSSKPEIRDASSAHTCIAVNERDNGINVQATYGLYSGVQCQEIDAVGIGFQWITEAGFLKAVDIWSYVEQGVQVCFDAAGTLLFLDAATAPRTVYAIAAFSINGKTCTSLWRPGSIVLRPTASNDGALPQATAQPLPIPTATPTPQCLATTNAAINLRDRPSGARIGGIFQGETATVLDLADSWYQVNFGGTVGWISAAYVAVSGECDFEDA